MAAALRFTFVKGIARVPVLQQHSQSIRTLFGDWSESQTCLRIEPFADCAVLTIDAIHSFRGVGEVTRRAEARLPLALSPRCRVIPLPA